MKRYKVSIVVPTQWNVEVEAESEEEAMSEALDLEGPGVPACFGDNLDEWEHEILEWPNLGKNDKPEVEHLYDIDEQI